MTDATLYLSASIANAEVNLRLAEALEGSRFELVLPQTFTPDVPHAALPRAVVDRCLEAMARCDAAVLMLDGFGVDCAMEVGWLHARGTPVIGVAAASTRFVQHWMVKATLDALVALDPSVDRAVARDPMLGALPRFLADGWDGARYALEGAFDIVTRTRTEGVAP